MRDTRTHHFEPKKIDRVDSGGQGRSKYGPKLPPYCPLLLRILTFPDPHCQPGQIFVVQNGVYMRPAYSTTCFKFNQHLGTIVHHCVTVSPIDVVNKIVNAIWAPEDPLNAWKVIPIHFQGAQGHFGSHLTHLKWPIAV